MEDKKKIIDLYSKKRYMIIDTVTNKPLAYESNSYKGLTLCRSKYRNIILFDEMFSLKDWVINKDDTYFLSYRPNNDQENYKSAKNRLVWKRLPKGYNVARIQEKPVKSVGGWARTMTHLINFK